ncbi:MAG: cell envelope integrity protein CreD [Bacteroidota bacterium]
MLQKQQSFFERANDWLRNSITIRLITIGILIFILLIPVAMIENLIREREYRRDDAIREVCSKWGERQTIKGLVLTVPYYVYTKVYDKDDNIKYKLIKTTEYAHFLPDELNIEGLIQPEVRYRGIYEVIVYNSEIKLTGLFSAPDFEEWDITSNNIIWKDAFISLGLSDLRSIQENAELIWNGTGINFNPGVETNDVIGSGIHAKVPVNCPDTTGSSYEFSLTLNFNGSSELNFTPLGKETNVTLTSNWPDPSFDGAFLPDEREITKDGFAAKWNVLHLNRSYPQKFRGSISGIDESGFGVNLLMPVDEYQKSTRAAKYAVLFITLTFLVFFFIQVLNQVRIHPIQYILVGLALCVFYTLLISLSEHIRFNVSYLVASISIIALITAYARSLFKRDLLTTLMALILIILYGFIYTIIQLQDYALLMGSIGLFIVLAIVMYLSRNIDWYSIKTTKDEGEE